MARTIFAKVEDEDCKFKSRNILESWSLKITHQLHVKLNEIPSVVSEKKQELLKCNSSHQSSRLGGGACLTPLAVEEAEMTNLDKLLIFSATKDNGLITSYSTVTICGLWSITYTLLWNYHLPILRFVTVEKRVISMQHGWFAF